MKKISVQQGEAVFLLLADGGIERIDGPAIRILNEGEHPMLPVHVGEEWFPVTPQKCQGKIDWD